MNDIVQWDPNSGAALPAYLTDVADQLGSNIVDRMTVPSLSYEGKTWTIVVNGNKTKLQAKNSDGDMVPIPIMRAIVLGYNPDRGRAYYPGTYNPAQSAQPDCWSPDGKDPDPSSKNRQSTSCNGCPMSVKGSKVDNGREMIACGSHRMVAVAPAFEIEHDPLRLKIAVTSDYDKEVVEHGWFAFRQYADFLKSKGISHTALVVTKIKFDNNQAYPKLLFAIDRLLSQAEVEQVKRALQNPKLQDVLTEKWSAAGVNGTKTDDADIRPHGLEGAYADGWTAHPDAAGYSYKGQEVVKNEDLAARYPAPTPPPVQQEVIPAAPAPEKPAVPAAPPVVIEAEAKVVETPKLFGLSAAVADGWAPHPSAPGYHYKGQEVVADADLEARYPAAPAAPPPPPVVEVAPAHDPMAAALADGWLPHPSAPGYHYKGQEVVADGDLPARYPSANGGTAAAGNGGATSSQGAAGTAGSGQTATSTASPSDPASPAPTGDASIPPEVGALLSKWG